MNTDHLVKDRECLKCDKFFDCPGKPTKDKPCLNFKERKKNEK